MERKIVATEIFWEEHPGTVGEKKKKPTSKHIETFQSMAQSKA